MEESLAVAVDFDGVIIDLVGRMLKAIHTEYGVKFPRDAIDAWDAVDKFNEFFGESWFKWLERKPHIWASAEPIPGALGNIERLYRAGYFVEIVTSKPSWAVPALFKWLGKYDVIVNGVIITSEHESKLSRTEADVLIDDRIDNAVEFADNGRIGILLDQPWNRGVDDDTLPKGLYRANSWSSAAAIVHLAARGELD